jgi:hypothetical protein
VITMPQNMGATNQHIHCTVSNCHYWDQGNICVASEVLVTSDQMANDKPDSYDHQMAVRAPQTPVEACSDSCCKTFVPKNSQNIKEDGATRLK